MIENLYNVVFNLYSYEYSGRVDIGGVSKTAAFKTSQKGYYTYLRGGEQYKFGKNNVIAKYRLFCAPLDIKSTDLVQIQNLWFRIVAIDPCSNFKHHLEVTLKAVGPQSIIVETGWTWGEEHPLIESPESWKLWTYKESTIEADNTGAWGELTVTSTKEFVSPVKDTTWIGVKYIELSYDNYATCSHNSGTYIWWRGSNTTFIQAADEITGPTWTLYSGSVETDYRYLQIKIAQYV